MEDLEDEESHTCKCHWDDWCTCGAARRAEQRKAWKAEGKGKGKPPVSPGRIDKAAKRGRDRDRKNRVEREESPETKEVIEEDEELEEEAINGKEKASKKQGADKENDARGQEKETRETHGLTYKDVRDAQRHPLRTEL